MNNPIRRGARSSRGTKKETETMVDQTADTTAGPSVETEGPQPEPEPKPEKKATRKRAPRKKASESKETETAPEESATSVKTPSKRKRNPGKKKSAEPSEVQASEEATSVTPSLFDQPESVKLLPPAPEIKHETTDTVTHTDATVAEVAAQEAEQPQQQKKRRNNRNRNKNRNKAQQKSDTVSLLTATPAPTRTELLIADGISLLSRLGNILGSQETTEALVDSLLQTNEETGETTISLNIPVSDRATVVDALNLLATLMHYR